MPAFWTEGLKRLCVFVTACLILAVSVSSSPALSKDKRHKLSGLPVAEITVVGQGHSPIRFDVEIADDERERANGLMYRRELPRDQGMLFEFQDVAERAFWMRNTYISLDILYADANGVIISIHKRARPFDDTPLPSNGAAKWVLEINAGLSNRLGIKPGDRIVHPRIQGR